MRPKTMAWAMAALMCGAAVAGVALHSNPPERRNFLEATVPTAFGEWEEVRDQVRQIIDPATEELLKRIYKETLSRTYVNKAGYRIMLSIARSGNQIGIQRAHLPEICYPAQGFELIGAVSYDELATPYGSIDVSRLTTRMGVRNEPVTYWLTMADHVVRNQWDKRIVQFRVFVTGESPDGLLFRVSSIDKDPKSAFAMQEKFVAEMMTKVSPEGRRRLGGLKAPGAVAD